MALLTLGIAMALSLCSPAVAAPRADPYPATVTTSCGVEMAKAFTMGDRLKVRVKVSANHARASARTGTGTSARAQARGPQGRVSVTITKPGGRKVFSRTVTYPGHAVTITGPRTDGKHYRVKVVFKPSGNSRFKACQANDAIDAASHHPGDGDNGDGDHGNDGGNDHGSTPGDTNGSDPGDGLPNTGGPDVGWLIAALALLLTGASLAVYGRRRTVVRTR